MYTVAPSPSGPAIYVGRGVSARTYMNAHNGNVLSVANAQNGIFLRAFAAATTGMSGFGGGGPAGAAGGAAGVGTAGAVDAVVAAAVPGAAEPRRQRPSSGGSAAFGLRSCGLAALQQVLGNLGHGCPR